MRVQASLRAAVGRPSVVSSLAVAPVARSAVFSRASPPGALLLQRVVQRSLSSAAAGPPEHQQGGDRTQQQKGPGFLSEEEERVQNLCEEIFAQNLESRSQPSRELLLNSKKRIVDEVIPLAKNTRGAAYSSAMRVVFDLAKSMAISVQDRDYGLSRTELDEHMRDLMDVCVEMRFWPTTKRCNILLSRCANSASTALIVFHAMSAMGVEKDIFTYNTLLGAYAREDDVDSARDVQAQMREAGVVPDVYTFNTLMRACAKAENPIETVNSLLDEMMEAGIRPSETTLNEVMRAHCSLGDVNGARAAMQEFREKYEVHADVVCYTYLMRGMVIGGQSKEATEVLEEMRGHGIEPDARARNVILDVHAKNGDLDAVVKLLEEIRADTRENERPIAFHQALSALQKIAGPAASMKVFHSLRRGGVRPDRYLYTLMLRGICREAGQPSMPARDEVTAAILDLERMMFEDRVLPNEFFLVTKMTGYINVGDMETALSIFNDPRNRRVRFFPSAPAYVELVRGFAVRGDEAQVRHFVDEYASYKKEFPDSANKQRDFLLSRHSGKLARFGGPAIAIRLLDDATSGGIEVDPGFMAKMVEAYQKRA